MNTAGFSPLDLHLQSEYGKGRGNLIYRFDTFELDATEFRLRRSGEDVLLEPKALRLLLHLVERAGHLVRKQELLDAVWPDTAVGENALTRSITLVRKALDDNSREPRFVATVPTLGYRFLAEVTTAGVAERAMRKWLRSRVRRLIPRQARWLRSRCRS